MATPTSIVIVGAALAGAKAAEALRDQGYSGALTLVGNEAHLPYERPPLSKGYLAGTTPRADLDVHDAAWYPEHNVVLRAGVAVEAIDRSARQVTLADGSQLPYESLILATGSRPRALDLVGADAGGVLSLRKVEDSDRINAALTAGRRLAVIGGGWIGMEIAANAREREVDVTVIEAAEMPLGAVLGPELAQVFLDLHREHAVTFHLGARIAEITTAGGSATGVRLADGTHIEADLVIVGIGAVPNVELATDAGLDVDNGVLVNENLQTSDPAIFAVGDIANHQHPVLGQRVRVEHWANALNQPASVAATILGTPTPYTELPYFFTDQYDLGMEYVGHAAPGSYTSVVMRGDVEGREFIAFWLDADRHVLAGMNVNVWDVVDDVKALIVSGMPVDPVALANPEVPLGEVFA